MSGSQADYMAKTAATILVGPVTLTAICHSIGLPERSTDKAAVYVGALKRAGLVYIQSWLSFTSALYAWQPQPFLLPDAPRPDRKPRVRNRAKPAAVKPKTAPVVMGPRSVFELGAMA